GSPQVDYKSMEPCEIRTHRRLRDIIEPTAKTVDERRKLNLPAGVDSTIKIYRWAHARMKIGLLGRKLGMTRVYDANGKATPVTVIEADGNTVLQVKNPERDGYTAVQVGFDSQKESRVP